jgi:hypothetical protein
MIQLQCPKRSQISDQNGNLHETKRFLPDDRSNDRWPPARHSNGSISPLLREHAMYVWYQLKPGIYHALCHSINWLSFFMTIDLVCECSIPKWDHFGPKRRHNTRMHFRNTVLTYLCPAPGFERLASSWHTQLPRAIGLYVKQRIGPMSSTADNFK